MLVNDLVEKLRSISEIHDSLSPSLRGKPFIVQRGGSESWSWDTFFVVRRVARAGTKFLVFGDLFRHGQFIRSREGDVLPLSDACVWLQLSYSTVVCVAIEAGICPMEDRICERVRKCPVLDDWVCAILALSDEGDGSEESE
jgi:hypothetical protein